MNLNLFGHDGQWIMVDCGVTFDEPLHPMSQQKYPVVSADPSFIESRRQLLAGIIITHAHEDHLGALPYLWQRLKAPVFTNPFAAEVLKRKLRGQTAAQNMPIYTMTDNGKFSVGGFDLEWISTTHSIPEPAALMIRTSAGSVLHTADWKIDPQPVSGTPFDPTPFQRLASENVTAMVCDSTNATITGHSVSEGQCFDGLMQHVKNATGRVVVSCFSSNIARLITLSQVACHSGRYMGLIGRSIRNMVAAARVSGHWPDEALHIDPMHLGFLPREEVLAVATGSQGEPRAMLNKLADGNCRELDLEAGDTVIFSAMLIPGNEDKVASLVKKFESRDINVILAADSDIPIHASGHPCQQELETMYKWVKPNIAVPTHGEPEHMQCNANIASQSGVTRTLTGNNGDLFILAPVPGIRRSAVPVGRIAIDT
ncbi:ribonuclease J [Aestuariibacter salexigens]|uniref:ribonuclease J n=1 Tax=Aestuariibacter salexigens TaxID=226010 RepID=UPI00040CBCB6|nr:ribonuclease J [Aestuariibacter salexigens]